MKRGKILEQALDIINGERQTQYGAPEDSFKTIADYWTVYKGVEFSAKDVALMMTLFKIAREQHQGKIDNLVDGAGYLGIAGDMEKKEQCLPLGQNEGGKIIIKREYLK